jgi:hypothetical protein
VLVPALPRAELDVPVVDDVLELRLSRQLKVTRSPALKSLSLVPALPSTGRVRLSWLSLADALADEDPVVALVLAPLPGLRTVMVLALGSVETITALILELAFTDVEVDEVSEVSAFFVRCFASTSLSVSVAAAVVLEVVEVVEPCRDGVTVL